MTPDWLIETEPYWRLSKHRSGPLAGRWVANFHHNGKILRTVDFPDGATALYWLDRRNAR